MSDTDIENLSFYCPDEKSPEIKYLKAQRKKFYQISFASFKESECLLELLDANNETKNQATILGAHLYKLLHAL
jgi:pyruvate dehydrogenase complex dehydrogenase (E1) component